MCLAIPGRILSIEGHDLEAVGLIDFGGVRRRVSLAFTPEAVLGDFILAHAGVAIARLDEAAAARVIAGYAALPLLAGDGG